MQHRLCSLILCISSNVILIIKFEYGNFGKYDKYVQRSLTCVE